MKKHINEILSNPLSSLILLVGIIISMLSIKVALEIYQGNFSFRDNVRVYMDENSSLDIKDIDNGLKLLIDENIEFVTAPFTTFISMGPVRQAINTYTINSRDLLPKEIEIIKGKVGEGKPKEKTVIIGQLLEKYTEEIDGREYLKLENEFYEVTAIIKGTKSQQWDFSMFIDYNSMPQSFNNELGHAVILKKDKLSTVKELLSTNAIESYKVNLNAMKKESEKYAKEFSTRDMEEIIPLIIIGVINTIIFSILWGYDMKRNIKIKKLLGAKNNDIIFDLLQKVFIILGIATILSNQLYILLMEFFKNTFSLIAESTLQNSFIAFALTFIISLISLGILYFNVIRYKLGGDIK